MTDRATTWLDVARVPLSRRDRAALVLALELLRRPVPHAKPWVAARRVREAMHVMLDEGVSLHLWSDTLAVSDEMPVRQRPAPRLLRARLALAIRVLLRVDAGDYGSRWPRDVVCSLHGHITRIEIDDDAMFFVCRTCGDEWRERDRWSKESGDRYVWGERTTVPVRPLWTLAPETRP